MAALLILMLKQSFLMADTTECMEDKIFIWTQPVNDYLAMHTQLKNSMMIICGLMMDVMVLSTLY